MRSWAALLVRESQNCWNWWGFRAQAGKRPEFFPGDASASGVAIALAGDHDFLVLDEPVNGLDPQGIVEMRG